MQRVMQYSLQTLPQLVSMGKLTAADKLEVKELLLSGDPGVLAAFETVMREQAGYVSNEHATASYDDLCETLQCTLKMKRQASQTKMSHNEIVSNLRESVFTRLTASHITLLFAAPDMQGVAQEAVNSSNGQLVLGKIRWHRFDTANGWPNLYIEDAHCLQFNDVMFLASFHSPDVVFEQLSAIYAIARSACRSLKVIVPFFPTGTMERIEKVGEVATAATLARIISVTPHTAQGPTQLVFLDIHALQEQFYFTDDVLVHLKSCIHLVKSKLKELKKEYPDEDITIVFPDDGACKRFGGRFSKYNIVVCHKVRDGAGRKVVIRDGLEFVHDKSHCVIVDDLIKSGGTVMECAKALHRAGAAYVSAYVTHACFPSESWRKFAWESEPHRRRTSSAADLEYWQFLGGRVVDHATEKVKVKGSGKATPDFIPCSTFSGETLTSVDGKPMLHAKSIPPLSLPASQSESKKKDTSNPKFRYFWITNSIPSTAAEVQGIKPFEVLSIAPLLTYLRRTHWAEQNIFD